MIRHILSGQARWQCNATFPWRLQIWGPFKPFPVMQTCEDECVAGSDSGPAECLGGVNPAAGVAGEQLVARVFASRRLGTETEELDNLSYHEPDGRVCREVGSAKLTGIFGQVHDDSRHCLLMSP